MHNSYWFLSFGSFIYGLISLPEVVSSLIEYSMNRWRRICQVQCSFSWLNYGHFIYGFMGDYKWSCKTFVNLFFIFKGGQFLDLIGEAKYAKFKFFFMLIHALFLNANVGGILCFVGIMVEIVESLILELDVRFLE